MTEGHPQYRAIYFCCGNHETIGNNCQGMLTTNEFH